MAEQQKKRNKAPAASPAQQPNHDSTTIDLVELMYRLLGSWKMLVCLALVFAIAAGVYTSFFVTPPVSGHVNDLCAQPPGFRHQYG